MGIKISLCMIVKNSEGTLEKCLNSVHDLVDEINIIDTGSTDKTIEIASRFTDRIFHFDWINDFSAARNFSFSKATKDYIFWLDSDDFITDENRKKLANLKKKLTKATDYVTMYYNYSYDENGNVNNVQIRERIVKKACKFTWNGAIHEVLNISGSGVRSDIYINHAHEPASVFAAKSNRNLEILENLIKNGDESPKTLYYYALSLSHAGRDEESLEYLNKFFPVMPDDFQYAFFAYNAAHILYLKKKDFESAFKILADNEERFKDKSEFYCTIGFFYRDVLKNLEKAYACFTKALTCKGTSGKTNIVYHRDEVFYYFAPYYSLGKCQIAFGQHKEALESFKKALEYNSSHQQTKLLVEKLEKLMVLMPNT